MKVLNQIVLALVAMASLCLPVGAQDAGGRIVGTVTDPTGAGVAGAKVTVSNVASQVKYEKFSDQDGYFQVCVLALFLLPNSFLSSRD